MPTYVYRREDGSTFEIDQRITEDALTVCPTTGQKVKRVITGAGLLFKGSGFYLTDYARKGNGEEKSAAVSSPKVDTPSESKPSTTESTTSSNSGSTE